MKTKVSHFFQDWGSYMNSNTLVIVGTKDIQETVNLMERIDCKKEFIILFAKDSFEAFGAAGFAWHTPEFTTSVLWFANWDNDWQHVDVLVHETNHLLYFVGRRLGIHHELEASAYQQQYLFQEIRKKLAAIKLKDNRKNNPRRKK